MESRKVKGLVGAGEKWTQKRQQVRNFLVGRPGEETQIQLEIDVAQCAKPVLA
jgi:hypothetical protein